MLKVSGLDQIQREIKEAERALSELDGELGSVSFDPKDPASIESAIHSVNRIIDDRAGEFSGNSIVGPLIEEMKEKYREGILEKAAEARLASDEDE